MHRIIFFAFACLIGCGQEPTGSGDNGRNATDARSSEERYAAVLAELGALPNGLRVTHTPSEVGQPAGPNSNTNDWKYRWTFKTEVSAIEGPITVVQFGILAWDGSNWVLPTDQKRYNCGLLDQKTFIDWYACPDGRIEPGRPAVDAGNWAGHYERVSFQQKWFFIGVDANGKRCKGEAVVKLLAN